MQFKITSLVFVFLILSATVHAEHERPRFERLPRPEGETLGSLNIPIEGPETTVRNVKEQFESNSEIIAALKKYSTKITLRVIDEPGGQGLFHIYLLHDGNPFSKVESGPGLAAKIATAATNHFEKPAISPTDIAPILPTEKDRQWIARQVSVADATLQDGADGLGHHIQFLSPQLEVLLTKVIGKKGMGGGAAMQLVTTNENGFKFAIEVDDHGKKETWYLGEMEWFRDQFPQGLQFSEVAFALWKKGVDGKVDPRSQNTFFATEVFDVFDKDFRYDALREKMREGESRAVDEVKDPSNIRKYDLPKGKPIGYLGLMDANPTNDVITAGMVGDVTSFPRLMNSLGYNFVRTGDSDAIKPGADIELVLRDRLMTLRKNGVKDVFINLVAHGSPRGVMFTYGLLGGGKANAPVRPEALKKLFDEFSEMNFTVTTDACFAGGLGGLMKSYQDPTGQKGRVHAFLQSKERIYNTEGRMKGTGGVDGAPEVFSTAYTIFLTKFLKEGKPFGEAHWLADQETKKHVAVDPQAWASEATGGVVTP